MSELRSTGRVGCDQHLRPGMSYQQKVSIRSTTCCSSCCSHAAATAVQRHRSGMYGQMSTRTTNACLQFLPLKVTAPKGSRSYAEKNNRNNCSTRVQCVWANGCPRRRCGAASWPLLHHHIITMRVARMESIQALLALSWLFNESTANGTMVTIKNIRI